MSRINLKTDYEDGQVLHGDELNVNNEVTQLGVNDNFDRITNMETNKANKSYVDSIVAEKADATIVNNAISTLNLTKADKSELATKADQADLDAKASISYVDSSVASKANKSYVDAQLATKANTEDVETALEGKVNNAVVGNLNDLTTDDKTSIVNAINSIDVEASPIATTTTPGIVKPDGTTVTVDQDGTIHAAGGGGGGGTTDYALLSNKPQINSIELSGNKSLSDLGLMSANDINTSLGLKADKSTTYTKTQVDTAINTAVADKADASTVNAALEGKADKSTTYTKTAVDQLITSSEAGTDAKLLLKSDKSTTYTKTEVDSLVSAKADNMTFSNNVLQLKSGTTDIGDPVTIQVATNEIAIQDTEPSSADTKLWIDTSEDDDVTTIPSEVVDSLDGDENDKAPSVRAVNEAFQTKGQVLWTNPDNTVPMGSGTMNFSSADYDIIEIFYLTHVTRNRDVKSVRFIKGWNAVATTFESATLYTRNFTYVNDTQYSYTDGAVHNTYNSGTVDPSGNIVIPLYVIGYKTGLFN